MTRSEAREILMQILYELDTTGAMENETAYRLVDERLKGNHKKRGRMLLAGIINDKDDIDSLINANSKSWKTARMPKVDLAIMRLALGEMRFDEEIPPAVVINEAINLAKKFSTEQSSGFIHGVLGSIVNSDEKSKG